MTCRHFPVGVRGSHTALGVPRRPDKAAAEPGSVRWAVLILDQGYGCSVLTAFVKLSGVQGGQDPCASFSWAGKPFIIIMEYKVITLLPSERGASWRYPSLHPLTINCSIFV